MVNISMHQGQGTNLYKVPRHSKPWKVGFLAKNLASKETSDEVALVASIGVHASPTQRSASLNFAPISERSRLFCHWALRVLDIGGRTAQVLPREARVTGQNRRTKELQLQRGNVHYIPALHWAGETRRKTHKKSPRQGGTHTGQYKIILVVQTVQQSTRPRISAIGPFTDHSPSDG